MKLRSHFALGALLVSGIANAQSWDQHLITGTTDVRLPSGLGVTETVIAFGQPRFNPTWSSEVEDIVRVFELQQGEFVEVQAIHSSLSTQPAASFGLALDIDGDLMAIGDPGAGVVHLYRRGPSEWTLEQLVIPTIDEGQWLGGFGVTLDIANGRLVVGAPGTNTDQSGIEDGVVFVFEQVGSVWTQLQVLESPDESLFGHFGADLELDGDRLIVGQPGAIVLDTTSGAAHIYDYDGGEHFQFTGTVSPSQPVDDGRFGASVAISGSRVAVSAPNVQVTSYADGRVTIFEELGGTWTESELLVDLTGKPYNYFGGDLEFEGGELFVTSDATASVQRFQKQGLNWESVERYTTAAGFAWSVKLPVRVRSVAGRVVVTDHRGATVLDRDVFAKLEINCEGTPVPNAQPAIPDFPVILDTRGEQSFSDEPQLDFLLATGTAMGPGVLFYGTNSASLPFGDSTLCVAPPITRAAIGHPTSFYFSEVTLDLQSNQVANGGLEPGTPTFFQYWFRLPGGGSYLSSSLELVFAP